VTQIVPLMHKVPKPARMGWPGKVACDKGYSVPWVRDWLGSCGIEAVIARKTTDRPGMRPFDRETYRRRSVVEQSVGWLKEARRIGTRFEKYATNFLGMLKLAFIQRYLRILDPSNTA
jgi:transposase